MYGVEHLGYVDFFFFYAKAAKSNFNGPTSSAFINQSIGVYFQQAETQSSTLAAC